MEGRALVAVAKLLAILRLSGGQRTEVLDGLRDGLRGTSGLPYFSSLWRITYTTEQTHLDCSLISFPRLYERREMTHTTAQVLVAMLDVEVDLVRDLGALRSIRGLCREEGREGDDEEGEEEF